MSRKENVSHVTVMDGKYVCAHMVSIVFKYCNPSSYIAVHLCISLVTKYILCCGFCAVAARTCCNIQENRPQANLHDRVV